MRRSQGGATPGLIVRPVARWSAFIAALFFLLVLLPAFTLAPVAPAWAPAPLANWAFDARLAIGRPMTAMSSAAQALQNEPAVTLHQAGEPVTFQSQGLRIDGTLYGAGEGTETKAGVLLLHGSTPQGRKLGLYRLLGQELANRGYVVLAIDQRGFGESDDPPDVSRPESFDFVGDASNAITYLASLPGVDDQRLYLIGHSFGGDVAMTTAMQDPRVSKLVVIGPGRRFIERGGREEAPELEYFRRREMRYMRLQQPIPTEVYLAYRPGLVIEGHKEYFAENFHVPILLIDGELEAEADRRFLQEAYEAMAGEKWYTTLPDADHYANVANFGPVVIYDEAALDGLVRAIDAFLLGE